MKFKKNLFQTIKDPCLMLTYYLAGFIFIKTNYKKIAENPVFSNRGLACDSKKKASATQNLYFLCGKSSFLRTLSQGLMFLLKKSISRPHSCVKKDTSGYVSLLT
jgi:hypothetical protein